MHIAMPAFIVTCIQALIPASQQGRAHVCALLAMRLPAMAPFVLQIQSAWAGQAEPSSDFTRRRSVRLEARVQQAPCPRLRCRGCYIEPLLPGVTPGIPPPWCPSHHAQAITSQALRAIRVQGRYFSLVPDGHIRGGVAWVLLWAVGLPMPGRPLLLADVVVCMGQGSGVLLLVRVGQCRRGLWALRGAVTVGQGQSARWGGGGVCCEGVDAAWGDEMQGAGTGRGVLLLLLLLPK